MKDFSYNRLMKTQADVRQFILAQSEKSGRGKGMLAEWSRALGRNDAYLHQFIHRETPKKLDEVVRRKLADLMQVSESELLAGEALIGTDLARLSRTPTQEVEPGPDVERDRFGPAIPVLGVSAGGQEAVGGREPDFMLNGEVVNYVARPKGLANAKNVFSVYVTGDSMYPRYRERDLVILQKAAPAIGDDVVIELHPLTEGGEHPSFIKEFVARRGSYIVVRQFNPPKEIEFNMKEIRNIFRVIPTKEWVG